MPSETMSALLRCCSAGPSRRSPGGWHLVGRTPLRLFDARDDADPAWLHPGDEVHWRAIDRAHFDALERRSADGAMTRDEWRLA